MVNGKEREMGTITEKLNAIHDDVKEIKTDVKEQNGRIRKNEVKIAYVVGGLGLMGIAVAMVRFL